MKIRSLVITEQMRRRYDEKAIRHTANENLQTMSLFTFNMMLVVHFYVRSIINRLLTNSLRRERSVVVQRIFTITCLNTLGASLMCIFSVCTFTVRFVGVRSTW